MKNKILLAALLFAASLSSTYAQYGGDERVPIYRNDPLDATDVLVGGKVGASASTLTKLGSDLQFGPYGSIYAEMFISRHLSMALEVSYAHKGGKNIVVPESKVAEDKRDLYLLGPDHPYSYRFDYIGTSYMFKYYPVRFFNIYTGLALARIINAKSEVDGKSTDIMDYVHKGDFSIPVGAEIVIGKYFTIDGRWNWSPRWISHSEQARLIMGKSRHQFFSLTLGYKVQVF